MAVLAASGQGNVVRPADAAFGDLCAIEGPRIVTVGQAELYVIRVEDNNEIRGDGINVAVNNIDGDADITSVVEWRFRSMTEEEDEDADDEPIGADGHVFIPNTDGVSNLQMRHLFDPDGEDGDRFSAELIEFLQDTYGWVYASTHPDCGQSKQAGLARLIADAKIDGDLAGDISGPEQTAAVNAVAALLNQTDPVLDQDDCDEIALAGAKAAAAAGATGAEADSLETFLLDICEMQGWQGNEDDGSDEDDNFLDGMGFVNITCVQPGTFEISAFDNIRTFNTFQIEVECRGAPASGTLTCVPNTVEIIPALGNVSHSLCTANLLDKDGNAPGPDFQVDFLTDRCSIETSGVDTTAEWVAANALFGALNPNVAESAIAIETSAAATSPVDSSRQADTTLSFSTQSGTDTATTNITFRSTAAAILGCNPADAPGATPGVANVSATVEVTGGQDFILRATVTVIGPPASAVVAIASTNLRCGEQTLVTVTVKDSIGQNVSDHTRVEAVTNFGGVLGGTGAVAGLAGPVVPLSSTVAETFNGVATFFLITSETHTGPYQIIATTGGGGSVSNVSLGGVFSTATVSGTNTVSCNLPAAAAPAAPAPAPTIAGPRTGEGIRAPNTGDGGLADGSASSWTLFALAGMAAFAVAGIATLKFARR